MRTVVRPDSRFVYQLENYSPDFPGSEIFPEKLKELPFYEGSNPVYITPDNCFDHVKTQYIHEQRPLLAPIHIALGFHWFPAGSIAPEDEKLAGTIDGGLRLGQLVDLEFVRTLPRPDYCVTGAGVVSREGVRWGKGHGYGDISWAILSEIGLVDDSTPIVVCTHDFAVVDEDIPASPTDISPDWIITPTQTIELARKTPKPTRIDWDRLTPEFAQELDVVLTQLKELQRNQHGAPVAPTSAS